MRVGDRVRDAGRAGAFLARMPIGRGALGPQLARSMSGGRGVGAESSVGMAANADRMETEEGSILDVTPSGDRAKTKNSLWLPVACAFAERFSAQAH